MDVQHLKENVKLNENKIISLIAVRFIYDFLFLFKMLTDLEEPDEDDFLDACAFLTVNDCFSVLFSLSETSLEGSTVTSLSTVDGATVDLPEVEISDKVSVLPLSDGFDNSGLAHVPAWLVCITQTSHLQSNSSLLNSFHTCELG